MEPDGIFGNQNTKSAAPLELKVYAFDSFPAVAVIVAQGFWDSLRLERAPLYDASDTDRCRWYCARLMEEYRYAVFSESTPII